MPMAARVPSTPLLVAGGVALVAGLAILVGSDLADGFDRSIIDAMRSDLVCDVLSPLRLITELGSTGAVTAMAAVAFVLAAAIGPWRHGLAGALTILLASVLNGALKLAIARDRPDLLEPIIVEHGFSFPSGHAALGMVAYGVLAVLVGRSRLPARAQAVIVFWLGVLVGLIGLSRIWLGVHYPTDVLAGWIVGGMIVVVYAALTRRVSPEPAAGAVDADPAARRSGPPVAG